MRNATLERDEYWNARIEWSYPKQWDRQVEIDTSARSGEECGIYRFERSHPLLRDDERELTYIGIAFQQSIAKRVAQHSAQKLDGWRRRGDIFFSYGIITLDGNHVRARYEEIEHLFIYFLKPYENERKRFAPPNCSYRVENDGYRGVLPRELLYPSAVVIY